jgi:hypothetical protein
MAQLSRAKRGGMATRRNILIELLKAEDRAPAEADRKYPIAGRVAPSQGIWKRIWLYAAIE